MSSSNVGSASPCGLETLPLEILSKIYLYSGNPLFASVNKQISVCLSSQFIRLQFCVCLFRNGTGPLPNQNDEVARDLGRAQTLVFHQSWFSNNFARKVQREIMRLQKAQGTVNGSGVHPDQRVHAVFFAEMPRELLLQKSWGQAKVQLLHRLLKWGVRLPIRPHNIQRQAMMNAILKNNYRAVNVLHNHGGVRFHHRHFKVAVLHDCERRIVNMIKINNKGPKWFIDPSDEMVYNRAMELYQAGDPKGRQLLKAVFRRWDE